MEVVQKLRVQNEKPFPDLRVDSQISKASSPGMECSPPGTGGASPEDVQEVLQYSQHNNSVWENKFNSIRFCLLNNLYVKNGLTNNIGVLHGGVGYGTKQRLNNVTLFPSVI